MPRSISLSDPRDPWHSVLTSLACVVTNFVVYFVAVAVDFVVVYFVVVVVVVVVVSPPWLLVVREVSSRLPCEDLHL